MIKFIGSFETVQSLPRTQFPEYAFIGRSNVGKSSLINAIVGASVARTSNTPGRTQSINLFNMDDRRLLVDLPGYGYARAARSDTLRWQARLQDYLLTRAQLRRLFLLIDSRIGPRDTDLELMDFCDAHGIAYQVVFTKTDKRRRVAEQIEIRPSDHGAMADEIIETSASKKIGIDRLRALIGIK